MKVKQINKIKKKQWEKREAKKEYDNKKIQSSTVTYFRDLNNQECNDSDICNLLHYYRITSNDPLILSIYTSHFIFYLNILRKKWSSKYDNNKK